MKHIARKQRREALECDGLVRSAEVQQQENKEEREEVRNYRVKATNESANVSCCLLKGSSREKRNKLWTRSEKPSTDVSENIILHLLL